MEMLSCTIWVPPRFSNCGLSTSGGVVTMSCVGTPMQLASCGAPEKLPAPELELGLDVHPAGRSDSSSSAFFACAVWADVAAAPASPARSATATVESTAVNTPNDTPDHQQPHPGGPVAHRGHPRRDQGRSRDRR